MFIDVMQGGNLDCIHHACSVIQLHVDVNVALTSDNLVYSFAVISWVRSLNFLLRYL